MLQIFERFGIEGVVKVIKEKVVNQSGEFFEVSKAQDFLRDSSP